MRAIRQFHMDHNAPCFSPHPPPVKRNFQHHCFQYLLGVTSRPKRNRRKWLCHFFFFFGGAGRGGGKQGAVWSIMWKWRIPSYKCIWRSGERNLNSTSMKHGHEHFKQRNSIFMLESSIGKRNLSQIFRSPRALRLLKITSASGKIMFWQRTPFQMTREVK